MDKRRKDLECKCGNTTDFAFGQRFFFGLITEYWCVKCKRPIHKLEIPPALATTILVGTAITTAVVVSYLIGRFLGG